MSKSVKTPVETFQRCLEEGLTLLSQNEETVAYGITDLVEQANKTAADHQKLVDHLRANLFVGNFPAWVASGIAKYLKLEEALKAGKDREGGVRYFLLKFKGLIPVYELENVFAGRSNDLSYKAPAWLELAMKRLNKLGWQCSIKGDSLADLGGNQKVIYLCIKDQRRP